MKNIKIILPLFTSLLSVSMVQADLVTGSNTAMSEHFTTRSVIGSSGLVATTWAARLATRAVADFDNDGIDDIFDLDDDNDGMPDAWELQYEFNPLDATDADLDSDGDGISNAMEYGGEIDPTDPTDRNSVHTSAEFMALAEQALSEENLLGAYLNSQAAAKLDSSNITAVLMETATSFGDFLERPDLDMESLLKSWQVEYERNVFKVTNLNSSFSKAEEFVDANNNGVYDSGEPFDDWGQDQNWSYHQEWANNGQWDHEILTYDANGNGWYDGIGDAFNDANGNGHWDYEYFFDQNSNGIRDPGESFTDINGDGEWNSKTIPATAKSNNLTVDQVKTSLGSLIDDSLAKINQVLPKISNNWHYKLEIDQTADQLASKKTIGKLDVMAAKSGLLVAKGVLDFISAYDLDIDMREVTYTGTQFGKTLMDKYGSIFTIRNGGRTAAAGDSFKAAAVLVKEIATAFKSGSESQGFIANEKVDSVELDEAISYLDDFIAGMNGTNKLIELDDHNSVLVNIQKLFTAPLNRSNLPKKWKGSEAGETEQTRYDFDSFTDPTMNGLFADFNSNADLMALGTKLGDNYQQAYIPFSSTESYSPLKPNAELGTGIIISSNVSGGMFYDSIVVSVGNNYYQIPNNTEFVFPCQGGESLSVYSYGPGTGTITVKHINGTVIKTFNYGDYQNMTISAPQKLKPTLILGGENYWGTMIYEDEFECDDYFTQYEIYRKTVNSDNSTFQLVDTIKKGDIPESGLKSWTDSSASTTSELKYLVKAVFKSTKDVGSASYTMNEVGFYHPLSLENTELPDGTVMEKYNQRITPTGGQGAVTVSVESLPAGLSIVDNLISGVARQQVDNYPVVFRLTDSNNHSSLVTLSLSILTDDEDKDGLSDKWERTYFGSITSQDGNGDFDGDGLSNSQEYATYFTNPTKTDTDGDGMDDSWEVNYGLDPTDSADRSFDLNGDGIPVWLEAREGLDPTDTYHAEDGSVVKVVLRPGWNMVAVPFSSITVTYADIFDEISIGSLWIWDSSNQIYNPGDQHPLSPTQGAWIFTDVEITVPVTKPTD